MSWSGGTGMLFRETWQPLSEPLCPRAWPTPKAPQELSSDFQSSSVSPRDPLARLWSLSHSALRNKLLWDTQSVCSACSSPHKMGVHSCTFLFLFFLNPFFPSHWIICVSFLHVLIILKSFCQVLVSFPMRTVLCVDVVWIGSSWQVGPGKPNFLFSTILIYLLILSSCINQSARKKKQIWVPLNWLHEGTTGTEDIPLHTAFNGTWLLNLRSPEVIFYPQTGGPGKLMLCFQFEIQRSKYQ